jgi:uncharacterized RDD family membrane protein YckC
MALLFLATDAKDAMTSVDIAARLLRRRSRSERNIITPEGVPLTVELAHHGERATAFLMDLFIWFCAALVVFFALGTMAVHGLSGVIAVSVVLFIAFFVRNLYFIYFELAWRGATPGKRIARLRVIDRRGGPLLASAVIARNLTREIEVFIPLGLLIMSIGAAGTSVWERLLLAGWLVCCIGLMFVNRDRMRAGDLIAGTIVVALPRRKLSSDLVEAQAEFAFTDAQLKAYGAFELQVLEDLLRRPEAPESRTVLTQVLDRICKKIDWQGTVRERDTARFLRDFYTAQRAYLEREQLFGRKRADKYHAAKAQE